MMILMVLGVWFGLSIPASIVVGWMLRSGQAMDALELIGMDGPVAVYVDRDGSYVRMSLLEPTPT